MRCRVVVATHPQASKKSRIGHTRKGVVYELFFTHLPQDAFTASDVVALYLHRGAYAPTLADEDLQQDPDRWCSHSPAGQEAWQIINQWVWNLRLELGHRLHPDPLRTTEFAPACPLAQEETVDTPSPVPGYGPPDVALPWKQGRFSGRDFALQTHGTLRCPGFADASCARAAQGRRWKPARGGCGQHPQLPPLSSARAVSMEWQSHWQTEPS